MSNPVQNAGGDATGRPPCPALSIASAKELARHMAGMTRVLRDRIAGGFEHEKQRDWLHDWLAACRETLDSDLDTRQFADIFAQTTAYGLFAARCRHPALRQDEPFCRELAARNLPKTNPFLSKLFAEIGGGSMPEPISQAVDDIVDLLKQTDMAEVLSDFGRRSSHLPGNFRHERTGKADPVVYFYETFLAAYDPKMRGVRGVYYTPEPVVSYIVRSIDHLLKTRFDRPSGLADENTLILDPAAGTGTFLSFVIKHIHRNFAGQAGAWNDYVARHLIGRVFGFELLPAPYVVAHLTLGMQLQAGEREAATPHATADREGTGSHGGCAPPSLRGYRLDSDQPLGIYLANTLEEAATASEYIVAGRIAEKASADRSPAERGARPLSRDSLLVVLGNPPYAGISANRGEWITRLVDDYRFVDGRPLGERRVWLKNDYVKFLRFGQWQIERAGRGVLAFVTDHSYLDSPTFRGMRQNLQKSFDDIYILNLHGNAKRRETAPGGGADENVFDISQGVAIATLREARQGGRPRRLLRRRLGRAAGKIRDPEHEQRRHDRLATTGAGSPVLRIRARGPPRREGGRHPP